MTQQTVLVVDDDVDTLEIIQYYLTEEGYRVYVARDGQEGFRALLEHRPDLVLLDIAMPKMDGWETCQRIREVSDVPIIMLTARQGKKAIIRSLDLGADGNIPKPFQIEELKARVRATLRRAKQPAFDKIRSEYRDQRMVIDLVDRRVLIEGKPIKLSSTEFKLLSVMLRHAGQVLTPQQLLELVWGWEYGDAVAYVRVYVSHLRRKIEPNPKSPQYIITERGVGYRFEKQTQGFVKA